MANPTSNYGWQMPEPTDLVTDLPADFEVFGQAVDTSLADLLGGTTGQVLAKNSGTDMDFVWVTTDDANAIQNSIVDAKGDLISATAADTPARLAVGNNGETLVADSSTATGLRYVENYAAGKNKVINGDFKINQRSFTSNTTDSSYNFDRFFQQNSGGTFTSTPQIFTPGAAPVAGYEGSNFLQSITSGSSGAGDYGIIAQRIESVRTFANQTVTVSFYAKAGTGTPKIATEISQNFGSGGSPSAAVNTSGAAVTLSTSWARYSTTISVPSISGKTIGTTNDGYLQLNLWINAGSTFASRASSIGNQNATFQIWGVQVEAGSVATAFQTATGTIQGELAACQRYYYRGSDSSTNFAPFVSAAISSTSTQADCYVPLPVTMRTKLTSVDFSNLSIFDYVAGSGYTISNVVINSNSSPTMAVVSITFSTATAGRFIIVRGNNSSAAYLGFNAEL